MSASFSQDLVVYNTQRTLARAARSKKKKKTTPRGPDAISTASLDAANRLLTQPIFPHEFSQPKREPYMQEAEVSRMQVYLVRNPESRRLFPYDKKNYERAQDCEAPGNVLDPRKETDQWVWQLVGGKANQ